MIRGGRGRRGGAALLLPLGLYALAAGLLLLHLDSHPGFPYNWEPATARGFFAFADRPSPAIFGVTEGLMTDSGDSPLLVLPAWLTTGALGVGLAALRLPAALLSAAAVPLLWWLGRRLSGPATGLLAALLLALSPVFLLYGRTATTVGLSLLPALATVAALHQVLRRPGRLRGILALQGLLLLDAYAYAPIRFLWLLSLALLAGAWWQGRRRKTGHGRALLITVLVLPLFLALALRPVINNPADILLDFYDGRGEQVATLLAMPGSSPLRPAAQAAARAAKPPVSPLAEAAAVIAGDTLDLGRLLLDWDTRPALTDYWNAQGRLYPLVLVPLFLIGLGRAIWGARRQPATRLVLACFAAFTLPLLLTSLVHIGRLIFALPFLCLLVAGGYTGLTGWLGARWAAWRAHPGGARPGHRPQRAAILGAGVLLAAVAASTWADYAPLPAPMPDEAAVPLLRAAASGLHAAGPGVALVLGDTKTLPFERIQVGGYRLELDALYRFVDLSSGTAPEPAPGDRRPVLYFGAVLEHLDPLSSLPGLCVNTYFVGAAVADRFQLAAGPAAVICGHRLHYQILPN